MTDPATYTFIRERERLIAIACRIVEDRAVAEDLVQDSWLRWHEKDYPSDRALPIFTRILKNLATDWRRHKLVEDKNHAIQAMLRGDVPDTERVVIARQQLKSIVMALMELPGDSVAAFRMSRFEGRTYEEIGRVLGISKATAYRLVATALVRIAVHLD